VKNDILKIGIPAKNAVIPSIVYMLRTSQACACT